MPWPVEDRRTLAILKDGEPPLLTESIKRELQQKYFPRYPTKRAVLLPALHMIQHEHGWIAPRAMQEVAEFLELSPAEVLDTASFYEEYWLKPKGKYLVQVCRSLACEVCGSDGLGGYLKKKLGIEAGQTTPDGRFTLVELECLGACEVAPCAMINEVLHGNLTERNLDELLAQLPENPADYRDPAVDWEAGH